MNGGCLDGLQDSLKQHLSEEEKLVRAKSYWRRKLEGQVRITTPQLESCEVCIVVPVYGEDVRRIQQQLESLRRQTVAQDVYEVIYVVNNDVHTDTNDERSQEIISLNLRMIDYLRQVSDLPVYVIDKSSSGNEIIDCNVGRARNRGVAEATKRFHENGKNGILIQTDADTYFEDSEYLKAVIETFHSTPDVIGVAGGLIVEFDPDTDDQEQRELLLCKVDRLILTKIWQTLNLFMNDPDFSPKDTAFSGAHMLSRSFESAVIGGLHDIASGEDPQFGNDLTTYAVHNNCRVIGMKDEFKVVTALRDSDRTPSSFKRALDNIDLSKPLEVGGQVVTKQTVEILEQQVMQKPGGQELIEYLRKIIYTLRLVNK